MGTTAVLLCICVSLVPSPAEAGRLAALVSNLNHPRYVVREQASKRLVEAGSIAKAALRIAATSGDPETAARAKAALEAIVSAEVESLRPLPEIDGAWFDPASHTYRLPGRADMRRHLWAAKVAGIHDGWPWEAYFYATETWLKEQLAAGTSPRLLRLILADMHRRDGAFLSRSSDRDLGPFPVDADEYLRGGK